ncbi:hypothetical protein [Sigmofec virus UA08Rod_6125]|uniref:Uncharacterized protein n=1 Tax=Sigmofec virus UA08Rod_6125 TaxID=2929454 RepID=A0A976N132_9VIRU|nr:hypothetical protein [Sigmofec virus UA08Rod_6125]
MARQKMRKKNLDRKVFTRTAKHIRKKNLYPGNMRGGIRL